MDESTPSRTALMTSLIRALHSHYDSAPLLDDPWGDRLVPESARGELRQYILAAMDSDARAAALRAPDSILDDYLRAFDAIVVIRSRYTEDALKEAVERGTRQYVLIGAGFDSFALRRPAFSKDVEIFEIDHPATQTLKLERIKECGIPLPRSVHFIAANLASESLEAVLDRSPFRRGEPAFFSWLGVTPFLTREANLATLRAVATCGARGSKLVFTYTDQKEFNSDFGSELLRKLRTLMASMGEPIVSGFDPKELATFRRKNRCGSPFDSVARRGPNCKVGRIGAWRRRRLR